MCKLKSKWHRGGLVKGSWNLRLDQDEPREERRGGEGREAQTALESPAPTRAAGAGSERGPKSRTPRSLEHRTVALGRHMLGRCLGDKPGKVSFLTYINFQIGSNWLIVLPFIPQEMEQVLSAHPVARGVDIDPAQPRCLGGGDTGKTPAWEVRAEGSQPNSPEEWAGRRPRE